MEKTYYNLPEEMIRIIFTFSGKWRRIDNRLLNIEKLFKIPRADPIFYPITSCEYLRVHLPITEKKEYVIFTI